jgi:hypothetical protein
MWNFSISAPFPKKRKEKVIYFIDSKDLVMVVNGCSVYLTLSR